MKYLNKFYLFSLILFLNSCIGYQNMYKTNNNFDVEEFQDKMSSQTLKLDISNYNKNIIQDIHINDVLDSYVHKDNKNYITYVKKGPIPTFILFLILPFVVKDPDNSLKITYILEDDKLKNIEFDVLKKNIFLPLFFISKKQEFNAFFYSTKKCENIRYNIFPSGYKLNNIIYNAPNLAAKRSNCFTNNFFGFEDRTIVYFNGEQHSSGISKILEVKSELWKYDNVKKNSIANSILDFHSKSQEQRGELLDKKIYNEKHNNIDMSIIHLKAKDYKAVNLNKNEYLIFDLYIAYFFVNNEFYSFSYSNRYPESEKINTKEEFKNIINSIKITDK